MKPVVLAIVVVMALAVSAQDPMPLAGARVVVPDRFWGATDTQSSWGLESASSSVMT